MPRYSKYPDRPSPEELETLQALIEHGTIRVAADILFVSPATVNKRLDSLRLKSGRPHLHQLVAWAIWNDWLLGEVAKIA